MKSAGSFMRACSSTTMEPFAQVEAVLLSVPYGMRPAFSTGTHMPSPQAQKDGFKEY
ncbi:MAG: hypothetical protein WDO56_04030 [Gammaproteobacteria bacterium]